MNEDRQQAAGCVGTGSELSVCLHYARHRQTGELKQTDMRGGEAWMVMIECCMGA